MGEVLIFLVVIVIVTIFLLVIWKNQPLKSKNANSFLSSGSEAKNQIAINTPQPAKRQIRPTMPSEQWLTDKSSDSKFLCRTVETGDFSLFRQNNPQISEHVHPIALNSFIEAIPGVLEAIRGDTIVQVIGPSHLVEGLKSGTYHTLESGGHLGTVADSHGIVGNLRFSNPVDIRSIAVPAAIFQVASAVTLQYYLHEMNCKLTTIQRGIENLIQRQQNTRYAEIMSAKTDDEDVRRVLQHGHLPNSNDAAKVDNAIARINKEFVDSQVNLENFAHKVAAVASNKNVKEMSQLLEEGVSDRLYDAQLLLASIAVKTGLYHTKHELALYLYPERLKSSIQDVEAQIGGMETAYKNLQNLYAQLDSFDDIIGEQSSWQKFGNWSTLKTRDYNKKKQQLVQKTHDLRGIIKKPFPKRTVSQPFVIECRIANGNIESRYAMIAEDQPVRKKRGKIQT